MSGKGRAAKAKKRSYDYYSDYDDEDFEEYMAPAPAASSSSTSGKKRAVRGKAKKHEDPKEVASVQVSWIDLSTHLLSLPPQDLVVIVVLIVPPHPRLYTILLLLSNVLPYHFPSLTSPLTPTCCIGDDGDDDHSAS